MLFRPVYLKDKRMPEAPILMRPPPPPKEPTPPPPTPPPPPPAPREPTPAPIEEDDKDRIPMLICGRGVTAVYPKKATRDVLQGKVDYFLVDERGVTLFQRKHIFNALKLEKKVMDRYNDFPCIGAHQRVLARRPVERTGLGYRRRYISPELIGLGIYVSL